MKKILLSLLLVAGVLTSCDMNKDPYGTLNGADSFSGIAEATRYRNGIYSGLRSVTSSGYFTNPEIQMDMFQATNQVGNRGIVFASGDILPSTGEVGSYYGALLMQVASINYYLERMDELIEAADPEATDDLSVKNMISYRRFVGEAKFARAFYNALLLDRYCPEYTQENADKPGLGVQIFENYYPTTDKSTYPGRSTMNETLAFIHRDLDDALEAMLEYESTSTDAGRLMPMASYINSNVVKALEARIALLTLDYQTAVDKANEVISTGKYPLAKYAEYSQMWSDDSGNEIIFLPFENKDELGGAIGERWIYTDLSKADYVPTQTCLDMYARRADARYNAYFDTRDLNFEGDMVTAYVFNKFPGNPELWPSTNEPNMVNKPKPFRTSELYLIVAEASYRLGQESDANAALNAIRNVRLRGHSDETFSGEELLEEIQLERTRELIGEGFRMSDLRRWHLSMVRSNPQEDLVGYLWPSTMTMSYTADSPKYTWPIPDHEMQVNPQLAGQQNPGY